MEQRLRRVLCGGPGASTEEIPPSSGDSSALGGHARAGGALHYRPGAWNQPDGIADIEPLITALSQGMALLSLQKLELAHLHLADGEWEWLLGALAGAPCGSHMTVLSIGSPVGACSLTPASMATLSGDEGGRRGGGEHGGGLETWVGRKPKEGREDKSGSGREARLVVYRSTCTEIMHSEKETMQREIREREIAPRPPTIGKEGKQAKDMGRLAFFQNERQRWIFVRRGLTLSIPVAVALRCPPGPLYPLAQQSNHPRTVQTSPVECCRRPQPCVCPWSLTKAPHPTLNNNGNHKIVRPLPTLTTPTQTTPAQPLSPSLHQTWPA